MKKEKILNYIILISSVIFHYADLFTDIIFSLEVYKYA